MLSNKNLMEGGLEIPSRVTGESTQEDTKAAAEIYYLGAGVLTRREQNLS